MDHEVVPRPYKISDWLLNSPWDHFGLHQENNVKVTTKFEVPKRHILRPTLSIDMVQWVLRWEWKKRWSGRNGQGSMVENYCYNKIIMTFLGEEKMKTREWSTCYLFSF